MKIRSIIFSLLFLVLLFIIGLLGNEYIAYKNLVSKCHQNILSQLNTIEITFAKNTPESAIDHFINSVSTIDGVKDTTLTTSDQALKNYIQNHHLSNPDIQKLLDEFKNNPLATTASIKYAQNQPENTIIALIKDTATKQDISISKLGSYPINEDFVKKSINSPPFSFSIYLINVIYNGFKHIESEPCIP